MTQPSIFPLLPASIQSEVVKHPRPPKEKKASTGQQSRSKIPENPCLGCPREKARKVPPIIPGTVDVLCIGMAPGEEEEQAGEPFVGPSGKLLRSALETSGFDLSRVGFANLARCRPERDDFESKEWEVAEKRCWQYLVQDVGPTRTPIVLLGTRPVQKFLNDKKQRVTRLRGLWIETHDFSREGLPPRSAFVARHPSGILRSKDERERLEEQFREDIQRVATKILTPVVRPSFQHIYSSPFEGREFLKHLALHPGPWAYDIEAYDANASPSRQFVATDPCHPDWRLRGIAFSWGGQKGAYIDCMSSEDRKDEARSLLSPPFGSDADKWTFNGSYDDEGLLYNNWVDEIVGRCGDGMLALVALSDGQHESLALEKATADILKREQAWGGFNKSRMRDASLQEVAQGAIYDACNTFLLCKVLHERLARGEYL